MSQATDDKGGVWQQQLLHVVITLRCNPHHFLLLLLPLRLRLLLQQRLLLDARPARAYSQSLAACQSSSCHNAHVASAKALRFSQASQQQLFANTALCLLLCLLH